MPLRGSGGIQWPAQAEEILRRGRWHAPVGKRYCRLLQRGTRARPRLPHCSACFSVSSIVDAGLLMWLVRVALGRPYTFVVMAVLIVLLGVVTIRRMSTDILPEIDIPVVAVVWQYGGLPPEEMEKRVVSGYERFLTTTVNDIEHTESQTLTGVSVIKVFFHPGAKIEAATAQIAAVSQSAIRSLPPGAT